MDTATITCNLGALDAEQRRRREQLFGALRGRAERVEETGTGYRLLFPAGGGSWMTAAELLELERRCCPFLRVELSVDESGGVTMQLGGGEGVKEFLAGELGLPSSTTSDPEPPRTLALLIGPIAAAAAALAGVVASLFL